MESYYKQIEKRGEDAVYFYEDINEKGEMPTLLNVTVRLNDLEILLLEDYAEKENLSIVEVIKQYIRSLQDTQ